MKSKQKCSVRDIAKDLDIRPDILHQCLRKYRAAYGYTFPQKRDTMSSKEEVCSFVLADLLAAINSYGHFRWKGESVFNTLSDRLAPSSPAL